MPDDITICVKCKHFKTTSMGQIWYDQFCGHPDVENMLGIDPVTGRQCYWKKNDLGRSVEGNKHPYAKDINDGHCKLWEAQ